MRKDPISLSIPLAEMETGMLHSKCDLIERLREEKPNLTGVVEDVQIRIANGFLEATFIIVNE